MKYILFAMHLIHQCYLALGALPAPVNVTIDSINFEHILRWKPGPGTPPGTAYRVNYSRHGKRLLLQPSFSNSSLTMLNLTDTFKKPKKPYAVHLQALSGGMESPWSSRLFHPYSETVLGPPRMFVTGLGDRLLLNITLPRGKAIESIEKIYHKVDFSIFWKKAGESQEHKDTTSGNSHVINNLHQGAEYCLRAQPEIIENPNVLSSDWTCHFTSPSPVNPVPTALACVSVILILGGAALLGLIYTGFLCMLNTRLPNALQMSLVQAYVPTVDTTVPEQVLLISGTGGAAEGWAQDDDEDEEEEEAEGGGYENRAAGFSGATSSSSGGTAVPLTAEASASEDSGNSRTSGATGAECGGPFTVGALCQNKTGPSLSEQIQEEAMGGEGDEEGGDGCWADVNLLSVALGAQDKEEEGGEDEEGWAAELQPTDGTGECQPLVSMERGEGTRLLDNTALSYSPRSSDQSERGKTRSRYLKTRSEDSVQSDTQSALEEEEEQEEDEEHDEECSGYMGR